jgi:spermidine/putrescine transport system permease protein
MSGAAHHPGSGDAGIARRTFAWLRTRLLLAPTWVVLGAFFLVPLLIVLAYSFATRGPRGGIAPIDDPWAYLTSGAFFRNYVASVHPRYLATVWRSLWVASLTTVLCILASFPIAYYVAVVAPARRRALLVALVVVPFWTSFVIRTYAWMVILRTEGVANTLLASMGVIDPAQPLDLLYSNFAVMVGLVYGELPFMILPLYASLEKLDRSLLEAAADLGAGGVSTFVRVTLPLAMPGLLAGTVLVFIPSVGQFVVSDCSAAARPTCSATSSSASSPPPATAPSARPWPSSSRCSCWRCSPRTRSTPGGGVSRWRCERLRVAGERARRSCRVAARRRVSG